MKEHLDIGPDLFEMCLARDLHHSGEHGEHPRGNARDVRHILVHRLTGYLVALDLEIGNQGCLLLGNTHQICQRVDILNQDSTKVTHQRTLQIIIWCVTTT